MHRGSRAQGEASWIACVAVPTSSMFAPLIDLVKSVVLSVEPIIDALKLAKDEPRQTRNVGFGHRTKV